ncbi:hypothetical protein ACCI51_00135 [Microbulbifer echini]|uniref:Sulfotransferase family protein n=1 Tax=Microbulbifer echini TaxID=1529067 RepID=A0ABV4NHK4_9GAMM
MIVYFHIGTHKTGTTSIQSLLHNNKDKLFENGILYPESGSTKTNAHHNLVYESVSSWKYKSAFGGWSELEREVSEKQCDKVVLSAENFSGYYKSSQVISDILFFCEKLNAKPVIVVTIRPQVEYIDSIYSQNCATGYESRKYDEFLMGCLSDPAFKFEVLLGRWFDAFSDVRVLDYTKFPENENFSSFFSAIDCNVVFSVPEGASPLNSRRSAHVVEFCRKANEVLAGSKYLRPEVRHRVISKVASLTALKFEDSSPFLGMDKRKARLVDGVFSLQNHDFFRRRLGGEILFNNLDVSKGRSNKSSVLDVESSGKECFGSFMSIYTDALMEVVS